MISSDDRRVVVTCLFASVSFGLLSGWMHPSEPSPYMDEVFHIPQVQKYCAGSFTSWDPKITTLPGLYLITIGILTPISKLSWPILTLCDTFTLRCISLALSVVNFLIIQRITIQIHGARHGIVDDKKCLLSSLNIALFPLLYFFSFFYYTDVGSTFMVLLMYCLHLEKRDWFAAFIGFLAVLFRQTNIIWVAFVAIQSIGPHILHATHSLLLMDKKNVKFSLSFSGQLKELLEGLLVLIIFYPQTLLKDVLLKCISTGGGYVLVGTSFLAFLIFNKGIVVGDRLAHTAVFHPTQLLYFFGFSLVFSAPHCLWKIKGFLKYVLKKRPIALAALVLFIYGILREYGDLAHPYLLADNRHYTFYIWRRLLHRNSWSPYMGIPFYIYGAYCIHRTLRATGLIFRLSFSIFLALNLCPTLLLEFRYFIIPFLLYRLHIRPEKYSHLLLELALFLSVNFITLYLYMYKPFLWESEPQRNQRFMW
ncbi:Dol-P-Glc:Glc(2)Man(9)GlcNAc(2)-PP-Dol alpha-1_2-glucosyltransferase [Caligus rogercresseyi]|uniref:Dol-P-Glc:Glc(2)Man(9)GlcNAc(2)-PP-Dol alpha-1,2-glucosyltransferase n=1 Tax=Caligus rogercresseyi TaxID=217165 RepID=A0A7T8JWP9_CALRO|nr:Dol-P-Glc:Glc(2)Man(9)GlcNAc(2)-PP-Dol alpha-1_2-glucosyltransferase [Caligus rogercresseyi]